MSDDEKKTQQMYDDWEKGDWNAAKRREAERKRKHPPGTTNTYGEKAPGREVPEHLLALTRRSHTPHVSGGPGSTSKQKTTKQSRRSFSLSPHLKVADRNAVMSRAAVMVSVMVVILLWITNLNPTTKVVCAPFAILVAVFVVWALLDRLIEH